MKKLLSVFIFLIIPLLIAVPGYMGWQTQRYMEDLSRYIDDLPQYSASWREYQRGWFSSQGIIEVAINDIPVSGTADTLTLPFNVALTHGPVLIKERLGAGWFDLQISLLDQQEDYLKSVLAVRGDGPVYQLTARMNLLGNTAIVDRWLPFDYHDGDTRVLANGYEGRGNIGVDRVLDYSLKASRLAIFNDGAGFEIDVGGVSGAVRAELAKLHAANVAPGSITLSVDSIETSAQDGAQALGAVEGLTLLAQTWLSENDTKVNSKSSFTVRRVNYPAIDLMLNDVFLDLAYKDFSLAFIEQYQTVLNSAPNDAGASYWQEHVGNLILDELLPASPKMLLERLQFSSPEGQFVSHASLSVEGNALASAGISPQYPMAVLPYLVFSLNASADEPVVRAMVGRYIEGQIKAQLEADGVSTSDADIEATVSAQTQQMLDLFVAQKFVAFRAQKYELDLKYEKGEATLNGEPVPLPF